MSSTKKSKTNNNNNDTNNLSPETLKAFHEALEDVETRFILNLPPEELATPDRLFFQLEQAWWYYEDIICDDMKDHETEPSNTPKAAPASYAAAAQTVAPPDLPRFKKMQPFCRKLFEISPMLSPILEQFDELWGQFSKYRRKISTFGTILLNQDCTKVILCQDYNSKSWTFPAGKVNQHENGIDAGARETYEETGFDPNCNFGLTQQLREKAVASGEGDGQLPWKQLREDYALRFTEDKIGKLRTCYVCHGVPEDFPFAPVARKEVSAVEWHDIRDLPKRSFAVAPFMGKLKRWIREHGPKKARSNSRAKDKRAASNLKNKRAGSKGKDRGSRYSTPAKSVISDADEDLIKSGLGNVGDDNRWSEDDMFKVNEQMIGRKVVYDGNPQVFATKGFDGVDPHAFRVVGGSFMNSGSSNIAAAPEKSQMQPLYRTHEDSGTDDGDDFQPFFADGGEWGDAAPSTLASTSASGEDNGNALSSKKKPRQKNKPRSNATSPVVQREDETNVESKQISSITNASGLAILSMLRGTSPSEEPAPRTILAVDEGDNANVLDVFMTDGEITENSQKVKTLTMSEEENTLENRNQLPETDEPKENEHFIHLRNWVDKLPETKPTNMFGDFRFDVDAIMTAVKGN
jgi:mRNA-decapping enzyme subunit 2